MTIRCEVCEKFEARYVCQRCGARVCSLCFDSSTGLCTNCLKGENLAKPMGRFDKLALSTGLKLVLSGFILTFIGILVIILSVLATGKIGDVSFVILLLPIPLGVAVGPYGSLLLIVALLLMVFFLFLIIMLGKHLRL